MNIIIIASISCFLFAPVIGVVATNYSIVSGNLAVRWAQSPKPLFGGISMLLAIVIVIFSNGIPFADHPIFSSAALFTAVGIVDDIISLTPVKKLLFQLTAALLSANFFLLLPFSPWFVIVALWMVLFVNAFNLIDGMDGFAVSYAIAVFIWIAFLGNHHIFSYAVLGVCIGFLPYNLRNASLYLGDSGSHFLGSTIAVLVLPMHVAGVGIPNWHLPDSLPLMFPLSDIFFVVVTRKLRGISAVQPGTDHTPHRLARLVGERNSTMICTGITLVFILVSIFLRNGTDWYSNYVTALVVGLYIAYLVWLHSKTKKYFITR